MVLGWLGFSLTPRDLADPQVAGTAAFRSQDEPNHPPQSRNKRTRQISHQFQHRQLPAQGEFVSTSQGGHWELTPSPGSPPPRDAAASDATNRILPAAACAAGIALLHKSELPTPSLLLTSSAQPISLHPTPGSQATALRKIPPLIYEQSHRDLEEMRVAQGGTRSRTPRRCGVGKGPAPAGR